MMRPTMARSDSTTTAVPAPAGERLSAGVFAALLMCVMMLAVLASPVSAEPVGEEQEAAQQDEPAQQEGDDFAISVTPDDGTDISEGDELTFTIEATNDGDEAVEVDITHAMPAGFERVSSDPEGQPVGHEMVWRTSVEPGQTATFEQTVALTDEGAEMIEDGQPGQGEQSDAPEGADFSSTACVYQSGGDQALACHSSWHELSEGPPIWLGLIIGAVVVLAILAALLYFYRSRTSAPAAEEAAGEEGYSKI